MTSPADPPPDTARSGAAPSVAGAYVVDTTSGRELAASLLAVFGLLVAGACLFGPKGSHGPYPLWWPGVLGGLLLAGVAMLARAAMGDCLVIDPRTRTIWSQRSLLAWQTRRPVATFDDCIELAFAVRTDPRRPLSRTRTLWLVLKNGPPLALSSFTEVVVDPTGPAVPSKAAADCARRVAELVGVPMSAAHDFAPG